ncbi:LysM peptidoglycan-binding domain-containing protein [Azomonas macrocytogenes]|uniref:Nucleoid-associated protein YgaU n=1 Tax=Azomonas macrocytogenes TaxID=69962 RepID=A0A839T3H6_AZOMA|nr:LysM domain-containing protein [Azomonas macrocytogenes]MBB3103026.1 nucleoid-associated protein YgaU [Azomonas macrocytogenes]
MRKILLALLLASGLVQAVQLKDGYPERYTVVRGDTLWDISARFLSKPWEWPQIWQANPQVRNPHLIYPGDILSLVYIDGRPQLRLDRGASRGTVKLSPQIRTRPIAEAIPSISLESINSFLLSNRIVDSKEELATAPYVVAGNDERVISGQGDRIYGRGSFKQPLAGYEIFRQGKVYLDPQTKEFLGINADNVGSAALVSVENDIASLNLTRVSEEVRLGDRLFSSEERAISSSFMPSAPQRPINGLILDVPRGVTQVGHMDVVTLNKGSRDGLQEGNVLAVYKTGETVRDRITGERVKVPDERAGLLMVFRTYEKLSYGLVMEADRSLSIMDRVRNP